MTIPTFDVIVVGGSAAGLSAALVLGRARRSVLVLDTCESRNAPAAHAQGVFTRDGTPPSELLHIAREQLRPYGVQRRDVAAVDARSLPTGFELDLADGTRVRALRLLLATGVRDLLPDVPGLRELWGKAVHHCPYCHGWEVKDGRLAVYGRGTEGFRKTLMLHNWSRDLVLFGDGPADLTPDQRRQLQALNIPVNEAPVARFEGGPGGLEGVVLEDGSFVQRDALFLSPRQEQRSDLALRLGCAMTEDGVHVRVDDAGQTSVPGVYAAGDMTGPVQQQQVILAAASGAKAAVMLNNAFVFDGHAEHFTPTGG